MFNKTINGNVDLSILLVKICCAHNNFVKTRDGFKLENASTIDELIKIKRDLSGLLRSPNQSIQLRNKLADYFVSDVGRWHANKLHLSNIMLFLCVISIFYQS